MQAFLNDRFLDGDKAMLHVSDLSMQRGYAVFDFFRTVNGIPLFVSEHLDRFYSSAEGLYLTVNISRDQLSSIISELIKKSSIPEAGIRVMLTGGYSADSYHVAESNLLITCKPVQTASTNDFEKGLSVITYEHQRELPRIKSINYLMGVWLQKMLKEKRADDVLYYNKESITEFPRSNVFIITKDNKLITPVNNILYGITRKNVLASAGEIMEIAERNISHEELNDAAEIFLTSTTKRIIPVVKINDRVVGNGKPGLYTKTLYEEFLKLENSLTHLVSR